MGVPPGSHVTDVSFRCIKMRTEFSTQEGQAAEHFEILDFAEKMVINAWTSRMSDPISLYAGCIWYDGNVSNMETQGCNF